MRTPKLWRRLAGGFGLAGGLAAGLLWCAAATGQLSYVATHGTSMAPRFRQGDVAVVHPAASYEVGDIVAYHSPLLDTVVLHRIVARNGDRYILKGDNNRWFDRDQPTKADLIGTLWVHVPRAGSAIDWARKRLPFLAALTVLLGAWVATAPRHHRRKGPTSMSTSMTPITPSRLRAWRAAAIGLSLLAAACITLGLAAYTRPVTRIVDARTAYTHAGEFSYSAVAPPGPVYEAGKLNTGDPVYLRLVPAIDVNFAYRFTSENTRAAGGTISLYVEVDDGTGWSHRVELQPATRFHSGRATAQGHLAVADLQALVAEVRAATGVQGGVSTVTLLADIRVDATVAGAPVSDRFRPRLRFQLDPQQMRLTGAAPSNGAATGGDQLHPHGKGTVTRSSGAAARLEFKGHGLAVSDARRLGLLAVPAALAALIFGAALRRRLRAEPAQIELRHGHRIVPVVDATRDTNMATVDVTTMHDLARLADQEDRLILHQRTDRGDVYLFKTDHTVYRYTARSGSPAVTVSA